MALQRGPAFQVRRQPRRQRDLGGGVQTFQTTHWSDETTASATSEHAEQEDDEMGELVEVRAHTLRSQLGHATVRIVDTVDHS